MLMVPICMFTSVETAGAIGRVLLKGTREEGYSGVTDLHQFHKNNSIAGDEKKWTITLVAVDLNCFTDINL